MIAFGSLAERRLRIGPGQLRHGAGMVRAAAVVGVAAVLLATAAARAGVAETGDCAWTVKADADSVNVAFPDENARYWAMQVADVPGTEIAIRGAFPRARYISFNVYEGTSPIDAIADFQLVPDSGSNPFVVGAPLDASGTYTLHVVFGDPPADRAENTVYTPGLNGEPVVAATVIYRIYLPEGGDTGGVSLPAVRIDEPGADVSAPLPSCEALRPSAGGLGVNEAIKEESFPADAPGVPSGGASWVVSHSHKTANSVGPLTVYTGNPFYANLHNDYLRLLLARSAGDVVAFRAKAPTFPDDPDTMQSAQLRYWSICTTDLSTTRYVACVADRDAKLDAGGGFTVVVSDAAHRPGNLLPTDNWLPNGPYADYFVLYRHMLPDPSFAQAIQFIPDSGTPQSSMGEYYPATVVCSKAEFETDRCGLP